MPEAAIGSPDRVAANLVTSENLGAFNAKRLDLAPPAPPAPAEPQKPAPEVKAEAPKPAEPPKAEQTELELDAVIAEEQKPNPDAEKKQRFRERMSTLTQRAKDAEAKVQAEADARAKAEKEAAELRAKLAPPPAPQAEAPKAAPQRAAFASDAEYQDALIDHRVEVKLAEKAKAETEARQQAERARTAQTYLERATAIKAEVPDFDARIEAKKDLPIPPYIGAAILESEVGPRLALHFADHPEEAARLANLPPNAALREVGKIEAMIETQRKAPAPAAKSAPAAAAEVSAAPPPITPIQGRSQAVDTHVDTQGKFTGTYKEWKALRKQGKL